jgi:hypothetical protein
MEQAPARVKEKWRTGGLLRGRWEGVGRRMELLWSREAVSRGSYWRRSR